jgi:hypothetical protein
MDACSKPRYVLWMYVIFQVIAIGFMPCGIMLWADVCVAGSCC